MGATICARQKPTPASAMMRARPKKVKKAVTRKKGTAHNGIPLDVSHSMGEVFITIP
jgi:hypothetical protein